MKILTLTLFLTFCCGYININFFTIQIAKSIAILVNFATSQDLNKIKKMDDILYNAQSNTNKKIIKFHEIQTANFIKKLTNSKINLLNDVYFFRNDQNAEIFFNKNQSMIPTFNSIIYSENNSPIKIEKIAAGETLEIKQVICEQDYTKTLNANRIKIITSYNGKPITISYDDLRRLNYSRKENNTYLYPNPVSVCEKNPGPMWSLDSRLNKYKLISKTILSDLASYTNQEFYVINQDNQSKICIDFYTNELDKIVFLNINKNSIISDSEI